MDAFARPLLDPALPPPAGLRCWNGSDPAARYAVYRNNVLLSLIEALADTYPVVRQLVGDAFFHALAAEFVRRHPPVSPVLAHYGGGLAGFIAGFAPAASVPYLADVARLEWAYVEAFHAADSLAMAPQALAERLADPARLAASRLQCVPSVRLIRSAYAVASIWQAHQTGDEVAHFDPGRPEAALVVRPALTVEIIALDGLAAAVLAKLLAGASLGVAFADCPQDDPAVSGRIFSLLLHTQALSGWAADASEEY